MTDNSIEYVDVLVIGAGLSGIGAGWHLQHHCPDLSYLILEGRERLGGTWDLFRYPGIRSDSDMYTLGFSFRPWKDAKAIADGPAILRYLEDTAREAGIDRRIRYGHKVQSADWDSAQACWTVTILKEGQAQPVRMRCNFLYTCCGYYRYEAGYTPDFPGRDDFQGPIIHPQHWREDIDCHGKRVVVIGSGATAVTLVPALARDASQVTMLQRSPTWVVSRPAQDTMANRLRRWLPQRAAWWLTRWKNVLFGMYFFNLCRRKPELARRGLLKMLRPQLPEGYDIAAHFTPRYNPWEQRLCLVPDGDLFEAIRAGKAAVVTDRIERFTREGIQLASGRHLPADLIVTATGLDLQLMGGIRFSLDGEPVDPSKSLGYKGMMYSGIPNLVSAFGYTNASWTLKADLTSAYACRLLKHMQRTGMRQAMPRLKDGAVQPEPWVDFSSGYIQRAEGRFPQQGSQRPWKLHQNYVKDILMLRLGSVTDEAMEFSNPRPVGRQAA